MFFWPYQPQMTVPGGTTFHYEEGDRKTFDGGTSGVRLRQSGPRGHELIGGNNVKGEKDMKKASVLLVLLLLASASFANGTTVGWGTIVGVITAPGTSNMVAGINSGGPWATTGGSAIVNLVNGDISFQVKGLNLVGGNNSGTPGPVTAVKGTLVCNPGAGDQAVFDTPTVPLSAQGDAQFIGNLGSVPASCNNPLFLVRVGAGAWIATGLVRTMSDLPQK